MQRMLRLLLSVSALLLVVAFAHAASAQERGYQVFQKSQEKATEAPAAAGQVQAVKSGSRFGSSGLNVKGRFNCKCDSGKGKCAVVKQADTIACKPGILTGCLICSFSTSTEKFAPQ